MADEHWLVDRARRLRREQAPAEAILWRHLRGRQFAGHKFRRQTVMGGYILDFYCAACQLVVELDGESHVGNVNHDEERQQDLENLGLKVIRFWNPEVFENLDGVLQTIYDECLKRTRPT